VARSVKGRDYDPPKREKIAQFQSQQGFPICPNLDDPDACNVYKNLNFPPEVYEAINAFYRQKASA